VDGEQVSVLDLRGIAMDFCRVICTTFVFSCLNSTLVFSEECGASGVQSVLNACATEAYRKADAQLNAHYKKLLEEYREVGEATKQSFVKSQRAWLAFRDAECELESSAVAGGSAQPMIIDSCLERLTLIRVKDFERRMTCEEGDLSCVGGG
jgi:uncharacterized protein YecT (DUF1311 family)